MPPEFTCFDDLIPKLRKTLPGVLKECADRIADKAQQLAPKDTGILAESIASESKSLTAVVTTDTPYAASIEFGTEHDSGKPFLRPAFDMNEKHTEDEVKKAINQAIE